MVPRDAALDLSSLCDAGLFATWTTLKEILDQALYDSHVAFKLIDIPPPKQATTGLETPPAELRAKKALWIDVTAESTFFSTIRRWNGRKFANIGAFGEERSAHPHGESQLFALVDAVDGTDLLERDLSNWCTAALLVDPRRQPGHKILAAFVGFGYPSTTRSGSHGCCIYYASDESETAWVKRGYLAQAYEVPGPSKVRLLKDASVCFYGQKISRLRDFAEGSLAYHLHTLGDQAESFRVYNLGGNPMLAKLVDHRVPVARWIDAVVDIGKGQQPYDIIPGAYIAKKGGAFLKSLDGTEITYALLEEHLLASRRLKYIAASTNELCEEIVTRCRWTGNHQPLRRLTDRSTQPRASH